MTEKYVELYKKYRPRVWEDVIGQDTVVDNLRNIVKSGKVPTSFIFLGPHGCGKTTCAFILSKALNCEHPTEDGNPCNQCDTCKAIDENRQMGFNYVSAANNGSVDAVRKLVTDGQVVQPVKKKVFLIDEAHSLSKAAFEALLIPLENENTEPLFIFCSTEPEKIISTIQSRSQIRTFNPVSLQELAINLKRIVDAEKLDVTDEQIVQIARASSGSVRDSIRDLETVIAGGELPVQFSIELLKLLVTHKYTELYALTNEMQANNENFAKAAQRLYADMSSILLVQAGGKPPVLQAGIEEIAKMTSPQLIIKYLAILGETIETMGRNMVDSRVLFEIGMSKIISFKRDYDKQNGGNK